MEYSRKLCSIYGYIVIKTSPSNEGFHWGKRLDIKHHASFASIRILRAVGIDMMLHICHICFSWGVKALTGFWGVFYIKFHSE